MTEIILTILSGLVIGAAAYLLAAKLADKHLFDRGRSYEQSKTEKILFTVASGICGSLMCLLAEGLVEMIYFFLLLAVGEAIAITDIGCRLIPNELVLSIIIISLVFGLPGTFGVKGFPDFKPLWSFIGMIACLLVFSLPAAFSKKVGAGDIKLAAAMGFCLGLWNSLYAIVLMGILVLVYSFIQAKLPIAGYFKSMIPMGPFLSLSMVVILLMMKLPYFSQYVQSMPFG